MKKAIIHGVVAASLGATAIGFATPTLAAEAAAHLRALGQLDGGHISYAVLGRRSSHVSLVAIAGAVILTIFSPGLSVWTSMMVVMLWRFGRHHPRTFDEDLPLDTGRAGRGGP